MIERSTDRGRRRARRGRTRRPPSRWASAPAVRPRRTGAVAGASRSCRTVDAHRRAPAARTKQEGTMPTEAKRETVAELREPLSGSRTLIVSEYRGLTVKEIAEIRRALRKQDVTLPRRQEPADADRRPGHDRRGAQPAARSARPRSRSATTSRRPRRPSSTRPGRTTRRHDHRRRARRPGDRRRRRDDASPACRRARSCWRSSPAGCRRRSRRWPGCSTANIRNLGYALAQVRDQKAAGRRRLTGASPNRRPTRRPHAGSPKETQTWQS